MLKNEEKFSSIAVLLILNYYTLFIHYYDSANFKMVYAMASDYNLLAS